jgi:hypothetical protein
MVNWVFDIGILIKDGFVEFSTFEELKKQSFWPTSKMGAAGSESSRDIAGQRDYGVHFKREALQGLPIPLLNSLYICQKMRISQF